jgi:predicted HTH transcriptional regulator
VSVHEYQQQAELFTSLDRRPPVERGDVCSAKHGGNEHSVRANKRVNKPDQWRKIIAALKEFGPGSFKQIAERLGVPEHTISGRALQMRQKDYIRQCGTDGKRAIYRWTGKEL